MTISRPNKPSQGGSMWLDRPSRIEPSLWDDILRRLRRIRCWWRGWHAEDPAHISKFRYDVSGMCCECGKVGAGWHEDGE